MGMATAFRRLTSEPLNSCPLGGTNAHANIYPDPYPNADAYTNDDLYADVDTVSYTH